MASSIRSIKDFLTGIIYIGVGVAAIVVGRDYGMGTSIKMGPAYFPTVLSGLLILIGIISLARSFIQQGTPIGRFAVKGLLLVIAAVIVFGLTVRGAGLVVALPILVIMSAYASSRFRWSATIALAAGLTVFCILIFLKGLGVPLPVLGTWFSR